MAWTTRSPRPKSPSIVCSAHFAVPRMRTPSRASHGLDGGTGSGLPERPRRSVASFRRLGKLGVGNRRRHARLCSCRVCRRRHAARRGRRQRRDGVSVADGRPPSGRISSRLVGSGDVPPRIRRGSLGRPSALAWMELHPIAYAPLESAELILASMPPPAQGGQNRPSTKRARVSRPFDLGPGQSEHREPRGSPGA